METKRHRSLRWLSAPLGFAPLLAACFGPAPSHAATQIVSAPAAQSSSHPHPATLDEYRSHLRSLLSLVETCAKARDMKTCDPIQVGPDDEVPMTQQQAAPRRLVRYGWLRVLLSKAEDKDAAPAQPAQGSREAQAWENVLPTPRTTTQLLEDARARLANDLSQAGSPRPAAGDHSAERTTMRQVLSEREFSDLEQPDVKDTTYEKIGNWLNHVLERAIQASARAPWLGRALVWGFISAVCIALAWGLLQLERRWRIRPISETHAPAAGAASAVSWQLWLEDARHAAAAGLWREAIHALYWASISRLESKRLWPADRARTPREYLALVAADDPRQPTLATLTGSFERFWYGGRAAGEGDYQRAEHLVDALISGTARERSRTR